MMAFHSLEPFGSGIEDFRAGQIAATVANVNRDPKTKAQAWMPADFMPALGAEADRKEEAELAKLTPAERIALLDQAFFKGM
jgi:hypothetical protein